MSCINRVIKLVKVPVPVPSVVLLFAIPAPIHVAAAPVATVEEFTRLENEWNTAVLNKDAKTVQRSQ